MLQKSVIFIGAIFLTQLVNAQKLEVKISKDIACFTEGKDSILNYQIAEKSLHGNYTRSNYIHPLYSLDGQIITEDFPKDHLHHRGIFWAWHQLYIGDTRLGDGWEIQNFNWKVTSVKKVKSKTFKGIKTEVYWQSNTWLDANGKEKPFVKEITTIKVYPIEKNYRKIDIEIALLALEPHMRIGGSEDAKGYGGFSPRIRLEDNMVFTGPTGTITPDNLPVTSNGWLDISGALGKDGASAGITILCHPDNPGYPNPWILRAKRSMQNAVYPFPGATAIPLSHIIPTVLKYRLIIHQGGSDAVPIEGLLAEYQK